MSQPAAFELPPAPSLSELRNATRLLGPWRALTRPHVEGLENIPADGRALLVGNHTLYGLLDAPVLVREIVVQRELVVRGLGDRAHFAIPFWGDLLTRLGTVEGSREACSALMDAGETILVFPGGGREVAKRKGEAYKLIWKQRLGFARLALEHDYPIVPVASVGAEELYDIVVDAEDPLLAPLTALVRRATGRDDIVMPIGRGIGLTPLPRPQRFYFAFAPPIDPAEVAAGREGKAAWRAIRDRTRVEIERLLAELQQTRATDPQSRLLPRLTASGIDIAGRSKASGASD